MSGKKYSGFVLALFLAVILFGLSSCAVYAADLDKLNQELDKQQTQPVVQDNLLVEFVKLAFFLALIVGAAWSLVRLFGAKATQKMQGNWIHIIDEVLIGQNRGIMLCEVGDRLYTIGVTEHNISLLFEVNDSRIKEEIEAVSYTNIGVETARDLPSWIRDIAEKLTGKRKVKSIVKPVDFHSLMEEQARRLQNLNSTFPDYDQNEGKEK